MTTTSSATDLFLLDGAEQDALFRDARSAHAFGVEPVPDEVSDAVHDLVRWGPTALNSSPMRLLLVRSAAARERLAGYKVPRRVIIAADIPRVNGWKLLRKRLREEYCGAGGTSRA